MVESFANIDGCPSILRIETTGYDSLNTSIMMPPFLKVLREVTDDLSYETKKMSETGYKMPMEDKEEMIEILNEIAISKEAKRFQAMMSMERSESKDREEVGSKLGLPKSGSYSKLTDLVGLEKSKLSPTRLSKRLSTIPLKILNTIIFI